MPDYILDSRQARSDDLAYLGRRGEERLGTDPPQLGLDSRCTGRTWRLYGVPS